MISDRYQAAKMLRTHWKTAIQVPTCRFMRFLTRASVNGSTVAWRPQVHRCSRLSLAQLRQTPMLVQQNLVSLRPTQAQHKRLSHQPRDWASRPLKRKIVMVFGYLKVMKRRSLFSGGSLLVQGRVRLHGDQMRATQPKNKPYNLACITMVCITSPLMAVVGVCLPSIMNTLMKACSTRMVSQV